MIRTKHSAGFKLVSIFTAFLFIFSVIPVPVAGASANPNEIYSQSGLRIGEKPYDADAVAEEEPTEEDGDTTADFLGQQQTVLSQADEDAARKTVIEMLTREEQEKIKEGIRQMVTMTLSASSQENVFGQVLGLIKDVISGKGDQEIKEGVSENSIRNNAGINFNNIGIIRAGASMIAEYGKMEDPKDVTALKPGKPLTVVPVLTTKSLPMVFSDLKEEETEAVQEKAEESNEEDPAEEIVALLPPDIEGNLTTVLLEQNAVEPEDAVVFPADETAAPVPVMVVPPVDYEPREIGSAADKIAKEANLPGVAQVSGSDRERENQDVIQNAVINAFVTIIFNAIIEQVLQLGFVLGGGGTIDSSAVLQTIMEILDTAKQTILNLFAAREGTLLYEKMKGKSEDSRKKEKRAVPEEEETEEPTAINPLPANPEWLNAFLKELDQKAEEQNEPSIFDRYRITDTVDLGVMAALYDGIPKDLHPWLRQILNSLALQAFENKEVNQARAQIQHRLNEMHQRAEKSEQDQEPADILVIDKATGEVFTAPAGFRAPWTARWVLALGVRKNPGVHESAGHTISDTIS